MVRHKTLLFSVALLSIPLCALAPHILGPQPDASVRTRIAEGEYDIYTSSPDGGIGPFAPGVFNFSESWTLWRTPAGTFEVEGERMYESPAYEAHQDKFSVQLSADFHVLRVTDFRPLRWQPDSGPLTCKFLQGNLSCSSNAKNPANQISLNLPLKGAFGLLWPISAFSLSHITRFVDDRAGAAIPVEMVMVDEADSQNPAVTTILDGHLRYLGAENIFVARQKWTAEKFEMRVPLHQPFLIWTSQKGLLLDFTQADERGRPTETGMSLRRFEKFADF